MRLLNDYFLTTFLAFILSLLCLLFMLLRNFLFLSEDCFIFHVIKIDQLVRFYVLNKAVSDVRLTNHFLNIINHRRLVCVNLETVVPKGFNESEQLLLGKLGG